IIKDRSPKYNIELKDDKSYPYLKLTVNERFPRLFITRRRLNDGALYYGPYVDSGLLKNAVSFMKKVFPLRTCRRMRKKVCLEFHIGQCPGPCENRVDREEYAETVKQLRHFLEGNKSDLVRDLEERMKQLSKEREYEKAMSVKRRIEALTAVQQLHDRSRFPVFGELDELRNTLALDKLPVTIECFDISNISGKASVGSMVRFVAGMPKKSDYRKFRVRTVNGIDDYSMMKEVVRRRYARLKKEKQPMPDLVLIDGGKGHLSAAREVMQELGLGDVPVAGIAKEFNHLYTPGRARPIRLAPGSRLLLLIQRIRDEAHRFAVAYHRKRRSKDTFDSELRHIPGIGPVRERLLIRRFGDLDSLRKASREMLIEAGLDKRTAEAVSDYFRTS
ncbi:MAG: excinuclease ABC subunit UvrC, partial [Candidatus Omnitrophica bacterium]|nr:excinuclease ABC subunit UvrC [Candidatus Omnitrophota bacterium]